MYFCINQVNRLDENEMRIIPANKLSPEFSAYKTIIFSATIKLIAPTPKKTMPKINAFNLDPGDKFRWA
jgi:hypothetical protein